jgi:hypothetical protein
MSGWWSGKTLQFMRHLTGRVTPAEQAALGAWLTPAQLALFDAMHRADQRHGLDVMRAVRAAGHADPDALLAALLHDCGKGRSVGLWHRVAWSLGERFGMRVRRLTERLPGFREALRRIEDHPQRSADLALAAGCTPRAAALIRSQGAPSDSALGEALRLADEAN